MVALAQRALRHERRVLGPEHAARHVPQRRLHQRDVPAQAACIRHRTATVGRRGVGGARRLPLIEGEGATVAAAAQLRPPAAHDREQLQVLVLALAPLPRRARAEVEVDER